MQSKRGQITVFIMVGVVVLIVISSMLFLRSPAIKQDASLQEVPEDIQPVILLMKLCFESVSKNAILLAGYQGGRPIIDTEYLALPEFYTSYAYFDGFITAPSLDESEQKMNDYLKSGFVKCLGNLSKFPDYKISPIKEEPSAASNIQRDFVQISLSYPIRLQKGGYMGELDDEYSAVFEFRLGEFIEIEQEIAKQTLSHPDLVNFTFLSSKGVNTAVVTYGKDELVYIFRDEYSKIRDKYIPYVFAVKLGEPYSVSHGAFSSLLGYTDVLVNISMDKSYEYPFILNAYNLEVYVGESLSHDFNAISPAGRNITYKISSSLENIYLNEQTGQMVYDPIEQETGTHELNITVTDTEGDNNTQNIFITVYQTEQQ